MFLQMIRERPIVDALHFVEVGDTRADFGSLMRKDIAPQCASENSNIGTNIEAVPVQKDEASSVLVSGLFLERPEPRHGIAQCSPVRLVIAQDIEEPTTAHLAQQDSEEVEELIVQDLADISEEEYVAALDVERECFVEWLRDGCLEVEVRQDLKPRRKEGHDV